MRLFDTNGDKELSMEEFVAVFEDHEHSIELTTSLPSGAHFVDTEEKHEEDHLDVVNSHMEQIQYHKQN